MSGRFEAIYRESIDHPDEFWAEAAKSLHWERPWTQVLDDSNKPFYRWFPGGLFNTCYNALDRHVETGRADQAALIYDSPLAGTVKTYSYRAGAARHCQRGRVIIYMPMVPEAVIAMLGCARRYGWMARHSAPTGMPRTPARASPGRRAMPRATSRAVRLALMTLQGEMGYPSALSARGWGFYDVAFKGNRFKFQRPYASYVMEQVLFKISFPAEFHAQTAVECAVRLHPEIKDRLDDIERIVLTTHESAIRIICKTGPLHNYADRDHCLQYMVAVGLLHGALKADHYNDATAGDPRIDALRARMEVVEEPRYSREYHDPDKRAIANAIQIFFRDGSASERIEVEYPVGHRRRRAEGVPLLIAKFRENAATRFAPDRVAGIINRFSALDTFDSMPVTEFMELFHP